MRLGLLAGIGAATIVACGGSGEVQVKASSDEDAKANSSFSAAGQTDPNASGTAKEGTTSSEPAAPVADTPPPAAPAAPSACPLVCMVANKGRASQADEQRLSGELSNVLSALRLCGNGQNSLTMRFDSGATLTGFGVDAERGNEGACVEAIRQQRPAVTYSGPATLRCAERCGGTTTTRSRRRGR